MRSASRAKPCTRSMEDEVFERFTKEAVRAVHAAVAIAEERGDPGIGTEHLLVGLATASEECAGLVRPPSVLMEGLDGLDRAALAQIGIEAPVGRIRAVGGGRRRHRPFTSGGKQVLKDAQEEAITLGDRRLGPGHLLLAITRRPAIDPAIRLLAEVDVAPGQVRQQLIERSRRSA